MAKRVFSTASFVGVLGLAVSWSLTASATIINDPLHGQCNGSGGGACIDNGTNTPLGNSTTFSFSISPGPQTGDLVLDVLVPNNLTASPSPPSITEISPTSTTKTTTQVAGTWTSGDLAAFLGIAASPNNALGAFLPTTQTFDPTATGFNVFQADFGTVFIAANPPAPQTPIFDVIGGLPLGSYVVSFCESGCTTPPDVATAPSGALLVNGPTPPGPPPGTVPEPTTLALFGVGLIGLGLMRRRRAC